MWFFFGDKDMQFILYPCTANIHVILQRHCKYTCKFAVEIKVNKYIMYSRKQTFEGSDNESVFIWGARQTGKSTLLKTMFPNVLTFDLLLSEDYKKLLNNPFKSIE
jgi:predicted AAA+ superfamily ATPase